MEIKEVSHSISLRWEHPQKLRYYHLLLVQDLFGDWVLTKAWGGISQKNGRVTHFFCTSSAEALILVKKIAKVREQRGYVLREKNCN